MPAVRIQGAQEPRGDKTRPLGLAGWRVCLVNLGLVFANRAADDSTTMNDLRIREGQHEDCDSVLALWRLAGVRPSVTDTPERLRLFIEKSGGLLLVAEAAGQRVGTVLGGWDQWRGHIYRLAVHPDYRRRGIARALVGEIERRLQDRGAARIYALTYTEDGAAFWASLPYERTSDTAFVRTFR